MTHVGKLDWTDHPPNLPEMALDCPQFVEFEGRFGCATDSIFKEYYVGW